MKTREQKQKNLEALAQQFQAASAGMLVGFTKLTVAKDQELRRRLAEAGASYSVVKNTLARKAAAGTAFERVTGSLVLMAIAVTPLKCSAACSNGVPAAALRASVFLTTE